MVDRLLTRLAMSIEKMEQRLLRVFNKAKNKGKRKNGRQVTVSVKTIQAIFHPIPIQSQRIHEE